MNKLMMFMSAMLAGAFVVQAKTSTPEGWIDDYDLALKRAAEENKYIVADFSGSDWCGWCKKLDREVFDTEVFRKGAADKYVLLMIDSPSDKKLLSEKAAKQNPGLVDKYGIRGFPTVLILDAKGEKVAKLGYQKGGPEKYLKLLESSVKEGPDIQKYIKPIEDLLNAPDAEYAKESEKVMDEVMKRFPSPDGPMAAEAKSKLRKQIQEACKEAFFTKVFAKYMPIYDKAFAEAHAMKVPAHMEAKKSELINRQESRYRQMRDAYEDYMKSRKGDKD